eukprot:403346353
MILNLLQEGVLILNNDQACNKIVFHNQEIIRLFSQEYKKQQDTPIRVHDSILLCSMQEKKSDESSTHDSEINLRSLCHQVKIKKEFNHIKTEETQNLYKFIQEIRASILQQQDLEQQKFFIKIIPSNISLELKIINLKQDKRVLFMFKEISAIKRIQKSKTQEQFTNVFLNSTAHCIFTPINGIMGAFQQLELFVQGNNQALKYCTIIKQCLQSLTFQAQNMTEISKLRLKQVQLSKNKIYIEQIINEVYSNFLNETSMKNIEFKADISQALKNCNIIIDANKLKLILFNLLQNAFKYTRSGIVKITAKIVSQDQIKTDNNFNSDFSLSSNSNVPKFTSSFSSQRDLNEVEEQKFDQKSLFPDLTLYKRRSECYYLLISVEDSGIGIQMRQNSQLFTLFGNTKLSKEKIMQSGVGLGLTVSRLLAESMGGRMTLDWTEQDRGTKFDFFIPLKYQSQQVSSPQEQYFTQETRNNRNNENFKSTNSDLSNLNSKDIFDDPHPQQMKEEYKCSQNATTRISNELIQQDSMENFENSSDDYQFDTSNQESQILIVDDNVFNIEILQLILLHSFGLKSDIALNGKDAVDKVKMKLDLINKQQNQIYENSRQGTPQQQQSSQFFTKSKLKKQILQNNQNLVDNQQKSNNQFVKAQSLDEESKIHLSRFRKREDTFADRVSQVASNKIKNINLPLISYSDNNDYSTNSASDINIQISDDKVENENQMYKLIIMDINMPVLDGVEATKQIKDILYSHNSSCAIISHTAMPIDLFQNNAEEWFDGYLQKPIVLDDLEQIIKQINIQNRK